jgi:hypothetical protein
MSKPVIQPEHRRSWLLGLFMECPLGEELETCPAREFRKLSLDDRIQIADGVPVDVVDSFLKRHHLCLSARERLEAGGNGR